MVILISMYGLFNSTGSIADFIASDLPDGQQQIYMSESCVVCRSLFVCLFIIHSVNPYMVKTTGYRICHYKLRLLGYKITIFTYNGLRS